MGVVVRQRQITCFITEVTLFVFAKNEIQLYVQGTQNRHAHVYDQIGIILLIVLANFLTSTYWEAPSTRCSF